MEEALKAISEKEIKQFFDRLIQTHTETIGQLSEKELTLLQERVNVYKEIRESFISIHNEN